MVLLLVIGGVLAYLFFKSKKEGTSIRRVTGEELKRQKAKIAENKRKLKEALAGMGGGIVVS